MDKQGKISKKEKALSIEHKESIISKKRIQSKCVPPAAAEILLSHSATTCSCWRRSLVASDKDDSALLALATAVLCNFSAFALALVAES
jgi:hypothetical protein